MNKLRIEIERKIARAFVKEALRQGYLVSVNDGECVTLRDSKRTACILDAMFTTDEDWLELTLGGVCSGWVRFIYGNDGWDVISDYTTNLEGLMGPANKISERYSG